MLHKQTVLDPDLAIRRGGVGAVSQKFFSPFGPQFSLNIRGAAQAPRAPPPLNPPLKKTRRRIN